MSKENTYNTNRLRELLNWIPFLVGVDGNPSRSSPRALGEA